MATPLRILLIDTDEQLLRTAGRQLEALGNNVQSVIDTTAAVERCESGTVDVAIFEMMMPGMDGHGFIQAVRGKRSDLPVILMSADPEAADVVQAFRAGAADFLLKPFSRLEIKDVLTRLRGRMGSASRDTAGPIDDAPAQSDPEAYDGMRRQLMRTLNGGEFGLPVAPSVLTRVITLSQQISPDQELAVRTIESEVILGRAVMKLARSAQFRGQRPPGSVREAIARTGVVRALSNAAAAAQRANYEFTDRTVAKLASRMWLNHFVVALTAEVIGERIEIERPDRLQTMALFSEVGELVMLRVAADLWPERLQEAGPEPTLARLMREHRAKVSAMLLADWGMPADFIVVARWSPPTPLRSVRPEIQPALAAIVLARQLAQGVLGKNPMGHYPAVGAEDARLLPSFSPEVTSEIRREAVDRARAKLGVR